MCMKIDDHACTMMKMDSWQWTLGCSGGAGQAGAIAKTFNLQVISLDDDNDYYQVPHISLSCSNFASSGLRMKG